MGSGKLFHWHKRKQQSGSRNSIHGIGGGNFSNVFNRDGMAEGKLALLFFKVIIPPLYIWAWITNLDNVKSTILFVVALVMGMIRFYFFSRRQSQILEKGRQEAEMRRLDIKQRHSEIKEKELEQWERELAVRSTGKTQQQRKEENKGYDFFGTE